MNSNIAIKKVYMECPLCDQFHEVEERSRIATIVIKGEEVSYLERYFFCENSDECECEFETGNMSNENLLNARNEYRKKHNLLTSYEIVEIRENYGLTQVELARLLGWGEATISRYESKAIQDEAYDNMLRIIKEDPLKAIEFLDKNGDRFVIEKRMQIRARMIDRLEAYGKALAKRRAFECEYARYVVPGVINGYKKLDIEKIEHIITYLAKQEAGLKKNDLLKMLWYIDMSYYKKYGKSMTGLVYRKERGGIKPIGHYSMMALDNVKIYEEDTEVGSIYYIFPNDNLNMDKLSTEEKETLDTVIEAIEKEKIDILHHEHENNQYKSIRYEEIIPYELFAY